MLLLFFYSIDLLKTGTIISLSLIGRGVGCSTSQENKTPANTSTNEAEGNTE